MDVYFKKGITVNSRFDKLKPHDFPIFNVADCFICVGVGLMLLAIIREEKKNGNKETSN